MIIAFQIDARPALEDEEIIKSHVSVCNLSVIGFIKIIHFGQESVVLQEIAFGIKFECYPRIKFQEVDSRNKSGLCIKIFTDIKLDKFEQVILSGIGDIESLGEFLSGSGMRRK